MVACLPTVARARFFLSLVAPVHFVDNVAVPPEYEPAESVDASYFAVEGWLARLYVRIPDQIRKLLTGGRVGEIRRSTCRRVDGVAAVDPNAIRDDQTLVVERERPHERDPEQRGIGVVVDAFAQVLIDLPAPGSRVSDQTELWTVRIGRLSTDQQAVKKNLRWPQGVRQRSGQARHALGVENVDVRISCSEQARIDGKEETPRLELIVFDLAIDRLQRAITHGEDTVADDIPFLLRENRLQPHRADLCHGLNAVVATRDAGADGAGCPRLERCVACFSPLT